MREPIWSGNEEKRGGKRVAEGERKCEKYWIFITIKALILFEIIWLSWSLPVNWNLVFTTTFCDFFCYFWGRSKRTREAGRSEQQVKILDPISNFMRNYSFSINFKFWINSVILFFLRFFILFYIVLSCHFIICSSRLWITNFPFVILIVAR